MGKKRIIKDVYVYYSKLARPELAHQKKHDPKLPLKNKVYVVDALIKSDELEKLVKFYKKKGVKSLAEIKYLDKETFVKRNKCEPPSDPAYMNEDGEYGILKIRKSASYNDGKPVQHPPKVVGFKSLGDKSRNGFLIKGRETELGNGTLTNIEIDERTYSIPNSNKQGMALDLWGLQVINLVEYVRKSTGFEDAGDSFEKEYDSDFDEDEESSGFEDAGDSMDEQGSDEPEPEDEDEDEWDA